jgi:hypothetical protein
MRRRGRGSLRSARDPVQHVGSVLGSISAVWLTRVIEPGNQFCNKGFRTILACRDLNAPGPKSRLEGGIQCGMNSGRTVFSQLISFLPDREFAVVSLVAEAIIDFGNFLAGTSI